MHKVGRGKFGALTVALCVLLLVLAGCGGGNKAPVEETSAEPQAAAPVQETKAAEPSAKIETIPVTVAGTDMIAIKHLPMFINSFGQMTGVQPKFTEFQGGSQVAKALREGQVDFAFMAVEHVLKDQSGEMKLVALVTRYPGHTLLVDVAYKDQIKTVADLKGQKVGVSTLGSGPHQTLNLLLSKSGIDPNLVTVLPVGSNAPQVFKEQKVAAMISLEPFTSQAIQSGQAYVLMDARKADGVKQLWGQDELPWVALVTRQAVIDQNADVVQKMVSEIVRSQKLLFGSSGSEVVEMVPPGFKTDPALFVAIFEANKEAFSPNGALNESAVNVVWQSLQETGAIPKDKPLSWETVADVRFLANAPK